MPQMMNRESRKIFSELEKLANNNGVQGLIPPAHIYICDRLTMQYFTPPLINLLKSKIGKVAKKEWKHFTIEYWESVVNSMFNSNQSAKRPDIGDIGSENIEGFAYITNFLMTDYSLVDAKAINKMINDYSLADITSACNTAKSNNVFEIRYIDAILDKEKAKKLYKMSQIQELNDKIDKSNITLVKETCSHSPLELAMMEYNYIKKRDNIRLEKELNKILEGKSNGK